MDLKNAIGAMLIGLLLGGFGVVQAANLFGMTDNHARRVNDSPFVRRMRRISRSADARQDERFGRIMGRIVGVGFALGGTAFFVAGLVKLIQTLI